MTRPKPPFTLSTSQALPPYQQSNDKNLAPYRSLRKKKARRGKVDGFVTALPYLVPVSPKRQPNLSPLDKVFDEAASESGSVTYRMPISDRFTQHVAKRITKMQELDASRSLRSSRRGKSRLGAESSLFEDSTICTDDGGVWEDETPEAKPEDDYEPNAEAETAIVEAPVVPPPSKPEEESPTTSASAKAAPPDSLFLSLPLSILAHVLSYLPSPIVTHVIFSSFHSLHTRGGDWGAAHEVCESMHQSRAFERHWTATIKQHRQTRSKAIREGDLHVNVEGSCFATELGDIDQDVPVWKSEYDEEDIVRIEQNDGLLLAEHIRMLRLLVGLCEERGAEVMPEVVEAASTTTTKPCSVAEWRAHCDAHGVTSYHDMGVVLPKAACSVAEWRAHCDAHGVTSYHDMGVVLPKEEQEPSPLQEAAPSPSPPPQVEASREAWRAHCDEHGVTSYHDFGVRLGSPPPPTTAVEAEEDRLLKMAIAESLTQDSPAPPNPSSPPLHPPPAHPIALPPLACLAMFGAGSSINTALAALAATPLATRRRIRHLNLDGCDMITGDALTNMLSALPELRALRGNGLACLTEEIAGIIGALPKLRYLDLSNTSIDDEVGGALFVALAKCASIRKLSISSAAGLTDAGMKIFGECGLAALLEDFCMAGCFRVTDQGVMMIAFPKLRRLNWCGSYKITDSSRRYILSQHPTLLLYNKATEFGLRGEDQGGSGRVSAEDVVVNAGYYDMFEDHGEGGEGGGGGGGSEPDEQDLTNFRKKMNGF
ncbi:hypothetical protein TeGR_g7319 [Tetraparma gracilis]|uniref:F-box domain-containing protein n=1 Tax=Tetraparma gracilis TaxID=2962635 RepID=A0ABQ6NB92_9STRA|nr:hypothetical protein TeGR_g7319 [Tetraparma gracilis]